MQNPLFSILKSNTGNDHPVTSASRGLGGIILLLVLASCVAADSEREDSRLPTDAEVEQYNALVTPEERIVCRTEISVGSNIPSRKCRMVRDMEATSTFHREQLRNILR